MSETDLDKIQELLDRLSVEEQFSLMESLINRLRPVVRQSRSKKYQDLYGAWKKYFPQDLDLDRALKDIREEWEDEWPQKAE